MRVEQKPIAHDRRGVKMQDSPDVWELLFEQTPRIIRWIFGALTLGAFSVAGLLWKWHRQDIARIEAEAHRSAREVHQRMDREFGNVHTRLDTIYGAILKSRDQDHHDVEDHERRSRQRSEDAHPGSAAINRQLDRDEHRGEESE